MGRVNISVLFVLVCLTISLQGFALDRAKRVDDQTIRDRFSRVGGLQFDEQVTLQARSQRRKMACFFVFDKEASAELNNNPQLANEYATKLAALTSRYTAHANIIVTNAGVELWDKQDRIPFTVGPNVFSAMPEFVKQFQNYLSQTKAALFGTQYAVGVLISNKTIVQGGYSEGPPCTTSGVSLVNFRPFPWSIGGLLAHELAHTLSVVHPFELTFLCQQFPAIEFCRTPNSIPSNCTCDSSAALPEQCLMTFQFGRAAVNAPRFTPCDIQMMNYFASNLPCLIR